MSKENKEIRIADIVTIVYKAINDKTFIIPERLQKYELSENKYPRNIIDALRKMEDDEMEAFKNDVKRIFNNNDKKLEINKNHLDSSVSKLLYLMAWKQGDMDKFDHIVAGINSPKEIDLAYSDDRTSYVFFQFGRHITHNEPIVDQHSIRAFTALVQEKKIIREALKNEKIQYQYIKDSLGSKLHKKLIVEYVQWVKSIELQCDKMHKIDNIMYSLGKYLKTEFKN